MTTINMNTEVMVLKGYINFYNTHPEYTRAELYKDYYGIVYEKFMAEGRLDKYLKEIR